MSPLIAVHILVLSLSDQARSGARSRRARLCEQDSQAGLSTLEIAIIALGLFLLAGIVVAVLTSATNNRLDQV